MLRSNHGSAPQGAVIPITSDTRSARALHSWAPRIGGSTHAEGDAGTAGGEVGFEPVTPDPGPESSGAPFDSGRPPRLVLVRQPDQLGVEGTNPQLTYRIRLVEVAERHRQVADDHDRARAGLNDDHL